ncbi:helix-turn-helix domain-containing protein [Paenibacillus agricola]|uniref:Helix-turn-helix transcriptional regulator n=1 Tax=Paenibacillus agricola TaxID=2716264 RepID=A0ABX0JH30_9BACL|nr:helix-turn-helix domain-containing protein [Paenibacillus agricola]NHN34212.1 helix-turn-helix transcriptional regulator [Paenibacillus agricola]
MNRFFGPRSFNVALFWQFFASYFILFIIPVIIASTFTYVFVVNLIEDEVQNSNNMTIRNFSDQTDTAFSSLQANMINLLGTSNLKSAMKLYSEPTKSFEYYEVTHSLMDQLNAMDTGDIVSNAYFYFAKSDLVIGFNSDTSKENFFQYFHPISDQDKKEYLSNFFGKKMMHFTKPYTLHQKILFTNEILSSSSNIATVMSYPFNSDNPDVYLVVNMKLSELSKHIRIPEKWVAGTAIVDRRGNVIIQSGELAIDPQQLLDATQSYSEGILYSDRKMESLSFVKSRFNDSWYYVSLINLETLLQPAHRIRMFTIIFLGFFLVLGGLVSFYLSKRLYKPILEIKSGLTSHLHKSVLPVQHKGNDYDFIKQFSKLLVSENKELSALVSGMFPIVQEDFIAKILSGEYRDHLAIELYAKEIDFYYERNVARTVLCIEIHYFSWVLDQISETSKAFMIVELKERILKSAPVVIWLCQTKPDLLACVVQHSRFSHFGPKEVSEYLALTLQQFNPYFKATIGVGKKVQDIGELYLSYESANTLLKHKSLHSKVEIITEDTAWEDRAQLDCFLSIDEVSRIFNIYKSQNYAKLLQTVIDLLDRAVVKNASAYQVKSLCSDVLNTWIRAIEMERKDLNIPFYSSLFERLNRCATWDEIKQCFEYIHTQLFQLKQRSDRSEQFTEILDYIHNHYGEELSVEKFAQQLNMSVSYFSRTFKETVGEKYVEYITKHRLMMAKRYLLETDMKIDEITEKVGYMGRTSFIRIFCKYEGITPGKYRTIHHR